MTKVISSLDLRYLDGKTWDLLSDFSVVSETLGSITVPIGFSTDFNSIPRGLWNLLPPDEYGEAAVIHDYLYRFGECNGKPITRGDADSVHREFVHFRHAPSWKERMMYWGLRMGGWKPWGVYRKNDPNNW